MSGSEETPIKATQAGYQFKAIIKHQSALRRQLDSGYSHVKALVLNGLSAIAKLPSALIVYFWLAETREVVTYILSVSAASFISRRTVWSSLTGVWRSAS